MKPVILLFLLFLVPACSTVDTGNDDDPDGDLQVSVNTNSSDTPSFGDAYVIGNPHDGDDVPALQDGILSLSVSYSGGCRKHVFTLNQKDEAGSVQLWFTHEANSDACEAYLTKQIEVELPQDIPGDKSIALLNPNGDSFALR